MRMPVSDNNGRPSPCFQWLAGLVPQVPRSGVAPRIHQKRAGRTTTRYATRLVSENLGYQRERVHWSVFPQIPSRPMRRKGQSLGVRF